MISEKLWVMMALMMVSPFIFILILPEPYYTVAVLGTNLLMLFYMRRTFKKVTTGLFGGKIKYQCLTCNGTRFDNLGTCHRCGGKSRKPI